MSAWDRAHNVTPQRMDDNTVALVFSDDVEARPSSTLDAAGEPKTFLLASTRGQLAVNIGGEEYFVNLNIMRKNPAFDKSTEQARGTQSAVREVLEI